MNILYNYGIKLNQQYNLSNIRKIYNLSNNQWFINLLNYHNYELYIKYNLSYLLDLLDLNFLINLNYDIIYRNNNNNNYELNWHLDDKKLIIQKISNLNKLHNLDIIHINKNIYALYSNRITLYTIIIYLDTFNINFRGGKIEFIDQILEPYRGMILFFDSRDIHKITKLNKGIRRCIVIKFYFN